LIYRWNFRRRKGAFSLAREGSQAIWDICERLYGERLDLQAWRRKIQGEGTDQEDTVVLSEEYDHTKGKTRVSLKKQV
jgi:hypothetical protein